MNWPANIMHCAAKLLQDEPMARHTSWRLGGPADRYYVPADLRDLQYFLPSWTPTTDVLWVGLGSNLLVRDGGFRGQVIAPLNALKQIELQIDGNLYVGMWQQLRATGQVLPEEGSGRRRFLCRNSRYRRRRAGDECRCFRW